MSRADDLMTLGLSEVVTGDVTAAVVKARYRELALAHHPDRGGDRRVFEEVTAAYKRVVALYASPEKRRGCGTCKGKRTVAKGKGFNIVQAPCPDCKKRGLA